MNWLTWQLVSVLALTVGSLLFVWWVIGRNEKTADQAIVAQMFLDMRVRIKALEESHRATSETTLAIGSHAADIADLKSRLGKVEIRR